MPAMDQIGGLDSQGSRIWVDASGVNDRMASLKRECLSADGIRKMRSKSLIAPTIIISWRRFYRLYICLLVHFLRCLDICVHQQSSAFSYSSCSKPEIIGIGAVAFASRIYDWDFTRNSGVRTRQTALLGEPKIGHPKGVTQEPSFYLPARNQESTYKRLSM